MFDVSNIPDILLRTLVVYLAVFLGLRIGGKRELGQMTPFDLVLILLIANAVQNSMVGPDTSVAGGLAAAGLLITADFIVSLAREHVSWLRHAVAGTPTLLVNDGQFVSEHLKKERLDEDDVLMALREHGFADVSEVRTAVLEVDGSISVVPIGAESIRTRRHHRFLRTP